MSIAPRLSYYDPHGNGSEPDARLRAWLPAMALVTLAHAGLWLTYTSWQTAQAKPLALPSIQIALISLPAPPQSKPAHQLQPASAKPIPQPAATQDSATAPPADTIESAPEETVAAEEGTEHVPPVAQEEFSQPLYNAAYLNNPPPAYPLAARRRGIEGTVVVRAQITEDGNCHQASLSKSSGYEMLDQAAVAAVKSWRFIPAKRGAQTISAWVEVPISFRLTRQNEPT